MNPSLARLSDSFVRLVLWFLAHTFYRVRIIGSENVPAKGGALLVCNHLSFMDACFMALGSPRPIRFIMHRAYYDKWWFKPPSVTRKTWPRESLRSTMRVTYRPASATI